ncbi:hypothetical protein [Chitiniphilus eburneus]|uniref:Uncharacterized protein n=1 Tax=Chitiniphilus eburneus TaxID=2571148 RepID=A0A4U0Q1A4_9NEIS|nr:hypothetical protein [Chitiniphilus eburneus]TJZ73772.1 hypothetical protein FAZ21_09110 [Chitiniphilus eburneus]
MNRESVLLQAASRLMAADGTDTRTMVATVRAVHAMLADLLRPTTVGVDVPVSPTECMRLDVQLTHQGDVERVYLPGAIDPLPAEDGYLSEVGRWMPNRWPVLLDTDAIAAALEAARPNRYVAVA